MPLLAKCHFKLRLYSVQEYRYWIMDLWEELAWLDETQIVIHKFYNPIRVHFSKRTVAPSIFRRTYMGRRWRYCVWGIFPYMFLVKLVLKDHKSCELNILAEQLYTYCLSSQLEMESSSNKTFHVTNLEFFCNVSRNINRNST